jgi:hypothetical protein
MFMRLPYTGSQKWPLNLIKLFASSVHNMNRCVEVLMLIAFIPAVWVSAQPPPTCPKGSGPAKEGHVVPGTGQLEYHWECQEGLFWPAGMDLHEADCPKGTQLVMSRQFACVPPAPQCGPKSAPILNPLSIQGWQCDRQQDCPPGTAASLSPVQGWECEPVGPSLACPKGTKFVGMAGGYCAPVDERTCRSLSGWQWESYGGCRLGYLEQ